MDLGGQQHGDVGPDPEEGLVAEGDLARVTADDVPGEPYGGREEPEREDAVVVALAGRHGEHEPDRDHPRDAEPAAVAGHGRRYGRAGRRGPAAGRRGRSGTPRTRPRSAAATAGAGGSATARARSRSRPRRLPGCCRARPGPPPRT